MKSKWTDPLAFLKNVFHPEIDFNNLTRELEQRASIPTKNEQKDLDFFGYMDDDIKSKSRKVSLGMVRIYKVILS